MEKNSPTSISNSEKKTLKILEERTKSRIKSNPPNFESTIYIKIRTNDRGSLLTHQE